jgi:Tfp pilus assembly protein PilV
MVSSPLARMRIGRRPAGEAGTSLVEVLIAIVILGIVGAAVLASVGTLASSGGRSRQALQAFASAQTAADLISAKTTPYIACAPESSYQTAVDGLGSAVPSGVAVAITSVEYFDGSAFVATCPNTVEGDPRRSQQITITATSSRATRRITFVKWEG